MLIVMSKTTFIGLTYIRCLTQIAKDKLSHFQLLLIIDMAVPDQSGAGDHRGHMLPSSFLEAAAICTLLPRNKHKKKLHAENRCTNSKFLHIKVS